MSKLSLKSRPVTLRGEYKELRDWAQQLGISESLLSYRIQRYGINVLTLNEKDYYLMTKRLTEEKC